MSTTLATALHHSALDPVQYQRRQLGDRHLGAIPFPFIDWRSTKPLFWSAIAVSPWWQVDQNIKDAFGLTLHLKEYTAMLTAECLYRVWVSSGGVRPN